MGKFRLVTKIKRYCHFLTITVSCRKSWNTKIFNYTRRKSERKLWESAYNSSWKKQAGWALCFLSSTLTGGIPPVLSYTGKNSKSLSWNLCFWQGPCCRGGTARPGWQSAAVGRVLPVWLLRGWRSSSCSRPACELSGWPGSLWPPSGAGWARP